MQEVVDEGGNENGLTGAGEAGHAEPRAWRAASNRSIEHIVEDNPRLVGNGRESRQDILRCQCRRARRRAAIATDWATSRRNGKIPESRHAYRDRLAPPRPFAVSISVYKSDYWLTCVGGPRCGGASPLWVQY